ncbi:MAG TPA: alpha-amylase family glycosyl hydrolase, partial [Rhodothermales bacterium]
GDRNWGYDPAALYAPSRAYGRPNDLRRLVDEAHGLGLSVFLDVIYNHLGPDGAYVAAFGPMFTDRHHTPWGGAMNLDDRDSDGVRAMFIDNALHWLREYHLDGLRLDATDTLIDSSPRHFLAQLSEAVAQLEGFRRFLIAEDARNINTLIRPRDAGGYGIDALWADDFHHQIRNITAGDAEGYYQDYDGSTMREVAETIRHGWYFDGRPSPTSGKIRGTPFEGVTHDQCVIAIQNHDQVGNRPAGNRLTTEIDPAEYRAISALLLFLPHLPLLFMGQEWAATTPFLFFTDHNEELGRLVTEGRRKEFAPFKGFGGEVPDPQDPATFEMSKLEWEEADRSPHRQVLALYRELLRLRPNLGGALECMALGDRAISVRRGRHHLVATLDPADDLPVPSGARITLHTEEPAFVPDGMPPQVRGDTVRFHRAGALICEDNGASL